MEFEISTPDYTGQDCREISVAFLRQNRKFKWIFCGVLLLFLVITLWVIGTPKIAIAILTALCLLVVNKLLSQLFAFSFQMNYSLSPVKTNAVTFDENEITIRRTNGDGQYGYDKITAVWVSAEYWFLFLNRSTGILAFKGCNFTSGDPAGFAEFITQKTGLPIRQLK